jgi:F-type H+-transporting ATPase subunit delta
MSGNESESIARVYARALFELAVERHLNETVRQEWQALMELTGQEGDFARFLESPSISRKEKTAFFQKVFLDRFSDLMMDFLGVVAAKDRLGLLPVIFSAYTDLEDGRMGLVKGTLTTAVALENGERVRYSEQINRAFRKTFLLKTKVDPSILGGMILTVGDQIIDGSIRGGLQRLGRQMRKNITWETGAWILEE